MHSQTRIITDNSAQFTNHRLPAQKLITVLPYQVNELSGNTVSESPDQYRFSSHSHPAPSVIEIQNTLNQLGQSSAEIIALTPPKILTGFHANLLHAVDKNNGKSNVRIINTPTISSGLGYLVEEAAKNAAANITGSQIIQTINTLSEKVYSLIATSNLSSFSRLGLLDPAQGFLGDYLGVIPLFLLDSDRIYPIQKIRSARHFTDYLLDFLSEFRELSRIDLIFGQSIFPESSDQYIINKIRNVYRHTQVNTLQQSTTLSGLIGPKSLSVIAFEI